MGLLVFQGPSTILVTLRVKTTPQISLEVYIAEILENSRLRPVD